MWSLIKLGTAYMNEWPNEPILMAVFHEMRVKALMTVGKKVVPPAVAFLVFWIYFTCGGYQGLYLLFTHPSAGSMPLYLAVTSLIIVILLLLSLPLHGVIWFGYRAQKRLNKRQELFYNNLCSELKKQPVEEPTMMDLIKAINEGLKTLKDKEFLNQL